RPPGCRGGAAGMEHAPQTRCAVRRLSAERPCSRCWVGSASLLGPAPTSDLEPFVMNYLDSLFGSAVSVHDGRVSVSREAVLASDAMDTLVRAAVFGDQDERDHARWLIWELGQAVGVQPASIHDLYLARGRGEVGGFTVPAINVRGMSYHTARSIFRTAIRRQAGAFIL